MQQQRSETPIPNREVYLQQFTSGVLGSPVPDFASTLITQAEQDAEDDNLTFLRGALSTTEENEISENNWTRPGNGVTSDNAALARRYTPAQLREFNELEERAQQIIQQEYNGWAPGTSDDDDDDDDDDNNSHPLPIRSTSTLLDSQAFRNDNVVRDRVRMRRLRDHIATRVPEGTSRHQEYANAPVRHPSRFVENGMVNSSPSTESSLRTTAMMQAVRQNTQMSPRSRSQLQRYILERENIGLEAESRELQRPDLHSSQISPSQRRQLYQEHVVRQEIQQHRDLLAEHQQHRHYLEEQLRQQQQRLVGPTSNEARRRRMWQNLSENAPSQPPPSDGLSIESTVRYLESLRLCESDEEGLEVADESGLDPEELCPHNADDFLLDTTTIPSPPSTSWLTVGSILSGTQHAMPSLSAPYNSANRFASDNRSRVRHPTFGISHARTTSPARPSDDNTQVSLPPHLRERIQYRELEEDRWPVKVTIHDIDYYEMTLSGTMEAFNVPDKSSPSKTSSIKTYLEGELIDFNKYTLETKSFKADPRVDGTYWRKLPPFRDMKDEAVIAKRLLSKDWLEQDLMRNWVLMRWKGTSIYHDLPC